MAFDVGTITARLALNTAQFAAGVAKATLSLNGLVKQASAVASSFRFIGGFAALGGLTAAVGVITDFEDALAELRGVLQGDIKEASKLDLVIRQLGLAARDTALQTGFTATELLQAEVVFAKAGLSAREIAENLKPLADFATAAGIGVAEAANTASNIIKGLGLSTADFAKTLDALVKAANTSTVDIEELAQSFKFVAGFAKEFNQSVETVTASLAVLGDAGIKGTLAGTALRQVFIALTTDFKESTSVLRKFGISLFESGSLSQFATGRFRQVTEILADIEKRVPSIAEKLQIFQARAGAAGIAIGSIPLSVLRELTEVLGSAVGTSAQLAATRLNTLRGDLLKLRNAVQDLILTFAFEGGILTSLREFVARIRAVIDTLARLDPGFIRLISFLITSAVQVAAFSAALIGAIGAATALLSPLGRLALAVLGIAKGKELTERFGNQLLILKEIAVNTFDALISKIKALALRGFQFLLEVFERFFAKLAVGDSIVAGFFSQMRSGISEVIAEINELARGNESFANFTFEIARYQTQLIFGNERLRAAFSGLPGPIGATTAALTPLADAYQTAVSILGQVQKEFDGLFVQQSKAAELDPLLEQIAGLEGSEDVVAQIRAVQVEIQRIEEQGRRFQQVNPLEAIGEAAKIAKDQFDELTKVSLGDFDGETALLVARIRELQAASAEFGFAGSQDFERIIDQVQRTRGELKAAADTIKIDLFGGVRSGVQEITRGILQGSRETISAAQIIRDILISTFENIFSQILAEKLKFDVEFKDNFAGLGKFARDTLSGIGDFLGGVFSGGGGGGFLSSIGSAIAAVVPGLAQGGIVTGPTLALLGEGGQDEVVTPLDRLGELGGGTKVIVQNFAVPPDQIQVREMGAGVDRIVEVVVGKVIGDPRLSRRIRADNVGVRPRVER